MSNMSEEKRVVRVGSRKSQLALIQTHHVIGELTKAFPELSFEVLSRTTVGDERLDVALSKIGEKSLFTKELEVDLESRQVDFVVHSLKDLPTTLPHNMVIGAILRREDPRDAVIMRSGSTYKSLSELPAGSVVGTSSVRRAAQIKAKYPGLRITDVRGNLNTRLKKLDDDGGQYSALILAAAGIIRMNWAHRITQYLESSECLHAVGQGALAIECREGDDATLDLIGTLYHRATLLSCIAERAFMRRLEGGCSAPVAAHAHLLGDVLHIDGGVWSLDGAKTIRKAKQIKLLSNATLLGGHEKFSSTVAKEEIRGDMAAAEAAGRDLAEELAAQGAGELLAEAKNNN